MELTLPDGFCINWDYEAVLDPDSGIGALLFWHLFTRDWRRAREKMLKHGKIPSFLTGHSLEL